MSKLLALWRGDLPLDAAFWSWTVIGGLLVNISTSIAFLALITADLAWLAVLVGYGLSLPYNVVALVGVWRSAKSYAGPSAYGQLARGVSLVLMTLLSLT